MYELVARYPEARRWEFWNEPEMWVSMRNPAEYDRWYRAFYQAAKEANPEAVVAVGTLTGWDFFRQLSPDLPVDAVTVHSYAGDDWGLDTQKILRLHEGVRSRGLNIPIWLTEYGWDSRWMDHQRRARTLRWVFNWALSQPFIELAHYHMLHDIEEERDCCFGLVGKAPDFVPKQPAYDTFRSIFVEGWAPRPQVRESLAPRTRVARARTRAATRARRPRHRGRRDSRLNSEGSPRASTRAEPARSDSRAPLRGLPGHPPPRP
jgi:hypothetical protein